MDEKTEKVVYEESVRALTQQESTLDGLRARAGTLLTAASIVTAFLGGQALSANEVVERVGNKSITRSEVTTLGWLGVACFVGVLVISIVILLPQRWIFSHSSHALMDELLDTDPPATEAELYRHLAYWNEVNGEGNAGRLKAMLVLFGVGCLVLAAEAVVWLIVVAKG